VRNGFDVHFSWFGHIYFLPDKKVKLSSVNSILWFTFGYLLSHVKQQAFLALS
jgi:hypothetical protein